MTQKRGGEKRGVKSGESRVSQKEEREKEESIMVNPGSSQYIRNRDNTVH